MLMHLLQSLSASTLLLMGIIQLSMSWWHYQGGSIVGARWRWGYLLGLMLMGVGLMSLMGKPPVLLLSLIPCTPLALGLHLTLASLIDPPPHPDSLFEPTHPAHAGCQRVMIPHTDGAIPAYLLRPTTPHHGQAVCIIPGAGDTKENFKWRIITALLNEGFIVLTFDPPGHGENKANPLRYPNCLTTLPTVLEFLATHPDITHVGVIGISLGGALAINSLSHAGTAIRGYPQALVIIGTPTRLIFNQTIYLRELWNTYRAPLLDVLAEISIRQLWHSFHAGGYRSVHSLYELFDLLQPAVNLSQLPPTLPILLLYGGRDAIAPPAMTYRMHSAAPHAELRLSPHASHVSLTLINRCNADVVAWLRNSFDDFHQQKTPC